MGVNNLPKVVTDSELDESHTHDLSIFNLMPKPLNQKQVAKIIKIPSQNHNRILK